MPNLMGLNDVDAQRTVSNFEFSGKTIDKLGASEYTLASIQVDVSPSVEDFKADLALSLKNSVEACKKSPRAENMLVRATTFCEALEEIHGFVNLDEINTDNYDQYLRIGSGTALYDATLDSMETVIKYGENLLDMDVCYNCNGIVFIITDGMENSSRVATTTRIKNTIAQVKMDEKLESLKSVLIGIGDERITRLYLDNFQQEVGINQFVWVGEATPEQLAKLAAFVSQSISSQSQSLGTGGASQDITF